MTKVTKTDFANSVVAPVFLSSSYFFKSSSEVIDYHNGNRSNGRYARYENPGWLIVEEKLAEIDYCDQAAIFPSGMSAIASTLMALCKAGDHVVYSGKGYRNITRLCEVWLPRFGISSTPIHPEGDSTDNVLEKISTAINDSTRIVILEVPSNPHLYVVDVGAVRRVLPPECLLVIDATIATPVNFNPILWGADLVIHSLGKYIGGHTDVMAGSVAGRSELIEAIKAARNCFGPIVDSLTAFLLDRSLHTLQLRIREANQVGYIVANWLDNHPKVRRVYYSGLESHPHHLLAKKILRGHGGLMSFELDASLEETVDFVDRVDIAYMATGFGSVQTLIEPVRVFTYMKESASARLAAGIADSLVRLSVGIDDGAEAIIDSMDAAFRHTFSRSTLSEMQD